MSKPVTQENLQADTSLRDRFLSKIRKADNGCLEWTGLKNQDGYGQISLNGKAVLAHRVAYTVSKGDIPPDHVIRHICDNPSCVNPEHLISGTRSENMQDARERGRLPVGPGSRPRKLTSADAVAVWGMLMLNYDHNEIAETFGMTRSNVRAIIANKTWQDAFDVEAAKSDEAGQP